MAAQLYTCANITRWDAAAIQKANPGYSRAEIEKILITHLGGIVIKEDLLFTSKHTKTSVTLEDFQRIYEFGKFPNVRDWLQYIAEQTGKLCTLESLYVFILASTGEEFKQRDTRVKFRANVY
jgi:hypothetical protein